MYLIWWSSTGLTASVMLIELDRFLAIRYPLKYPLWITAERSLGACAVAQLGRYIPIKKRKKIKFLILIDISLTACY